MEGKKEGERGGVKERGRERREDVWKVGREYGK